ncbi:MAG: hypothetical protein EOP37_16495 [Rubrivivax sp.]|nr:MAG: hypothetical protein EOP37_16495 [Rubrivivax sp.]
MLIGNWMVRGLEKRLGVDLIGGFTGQAILWSLLLYGLLRLVGLGRRGIAALTAAIAFAGIVLTQSVVVLLGMREVEQARANIVPIVDALNRGETPTEAQVKAAHTGALEPVMLVRVQLRQQLNAAMTRHRLSNVELSLATMLLPENLATAERRAAARARIEGAAQARETLEREINLILGRADLQFEGIVVSTPKRYGLTAAAMRDITEPVRRGVVAYAAIEQAQHAEVLALLKFLDDNATRFRLGKPPDRRLEFFDDTLLSTFDAQVARLNALARQAGAAAQGQP